MTFREDRQSLQESRSTLQIRNSAGRTAITFQFVYAISMLFAGRVVDRLGTKAAFALAIIVWSIGAIMHAGAIGLGNGANAVLTTLGIAAVPVSVIGFIIARAVLAIGEAGTSRQRSRRRPNTFRRRTVQAAHVDHGAAAADRLVGCGNCGGKMKSDSGAHANSLPGWTHR